MPSKYDMFDRNRLNILPLSQRAHDMDTSSILEVGQADETFTDPNLQQVADAIAAARRADKPVLMLMGAHVIKQGLSRYVIDFIKRGWLSGLAGNGACAIHDFELAMAGASTESVARYIRDGQFGLWVETGKLNNIVVAGDADGLGFGESVGKAIAGGNYPHKDISIYAAAYDASVPATVHIGIGYDIVHEHPNFDAGASGQASYRDFLILAKLLEKLEGGVVLCFGSAVMGPEVFLKALAMARNVASQEGREIRNFTSAVFDLIELSGDLKAEATKDKPEYYYRPYKTLLVRTVADGGRSFYIRGDHRATLPALHKLLDESLGQ